MPAPANSDTCCMVSCKCKDASNSPRALACAAPEAAPLNYLCRTCTLVHYLCRTQLYLSGPVTLVQYLRMTLNIGAVLVQYLCRTLYIGAVLVHDPVHYCSTCARPCTLVQYLCRTQQYLRNISDLRNMIW
jgi:hypothetical protein